MYQSHNSNLRVFACLLVISQNQRQPRSQQSCAPSQTWGYKHTHAVDTSGSEPEPLIYYTYEKNIPIINCLSFITELTSYIALRLATYFLYSLRLATYFLYSLRLATYFLYSPEASYLLFI